MKHQKRQKTEKERKIREKRIDFYLKNGVIMTDIETKVAGVHFKILYLPISADVQEIDIKKELDKILS